MIRRLEILIDKIKSVSYERAGVGVRWVRGENF